MAQEEKKRQCIAAVRIRGTIRASRKVRETLEMLNLKRNYNTILIDDRPSFLGMLKTVQHYVAWGEASKDTINILLEKRGRLAGNMKLMDEYAQRIGHKSLRNLADGMFECNIQYWNLPNIQPMFRLHPPTKGFKGKVKRSYGAGGELGYRGKEINKLIRQMA